MAAAGNVSAAKYLHTMIADSDKPEATANEWDDLAAEISGERRDGPDLAQIDDFGKAH
jgi:hypothetical protein